MGGLSSSIRMPLCVAQGFFAVNLLPAVLAIAAADIIEEAADEIRALARLRNQRLDI